jgi:hypothetical protein
LRSPAPPTRIVQTRSRGLPAGSRLKAMWRPLGEKSGSASSSGPEVSRRCRVPSCRVVQMSPGPEPEL